MKVRDLMTTPAIHIRPEESVTVAARMLEHYNIGALPVCSADGSLQGVLTDRDLAVRCLPSEHPAALRVADVMTKQVRFVKPDLEAAAAAMVMGREQIRRLPVVESGRICGMLSLGDLAVQEESSVDAGEALTEISNPLSSR